MKRVLALAIFLALATNAPGAAPPTPSAPPVPPWVNGHGEEKYVHKNDYRTPILPPVREGFPLPTCEEPPDDARVLRAMPHVARGVPHAYEEFRDDIRIVNELIVDKIDPARFFPLVGCARLHHCHWKCTVYYNETIDWGYPFPFHTARPRVQVVYIDIDHLHLAPGKGQEGTPATR